MHFGVATVKVMVVWFSTTLYSLEVPEFILKVLHSGISTIQKMKPQNYYLTGKCSKWGVINHS